MNRMSNIYKTIICLLITGHLAYCQTANNTIGCAELSVEFTAPSAASHFWKFGDGAASVSNLQNPVHSYVQPGTYFAQLFDEENGTQVGNDIEITVYPPIEIEIDADAKMGCAPLEINFTSTINIHPDIVIEDIVWTFGDGNSASGQNTSYTYTDNGLYTISVKVITAEDIKCDEPVIFPDYISLEGERTRFHIDKNSSCDFPEDFVFTNTTDAEEGSTFEWDFGNGEMSSDEGPHTITYDMPGLYEIELTTTSPSGCTTSYSRSINIGSPVITPTFPDTICLGSFISMNQSTIAQNFIWDFSGTSIDSTEKGPIYLEKRPRVRFLESGLQMFTLTAIAEDGCETMGNLEIFVYKPDANYSVGPEDSCSDPIFISYDADDQSFFSYTFNNDIGGTGTDVTRNSPTGSNIFVHPERDEYHINMLDSLSTRLIVTSTHGCLDTAYKNYFVQKPEAFFIPDVVRGCVPFEVNFSDLSFSTFEVQTRKWDFGDGQSQTYTNSDTLISHTFTTAGEHEVRLTITDINGCQDTSREVIIIAIDKDVQTGPPSPFICPDLTFCVDDTVSLGVLSNQIDINLHIESDEGRFNHCWKDVIANHTFQYPGVYPVNATLEISTVYIDSLLSGCNITIQGSRSDIDFSLDCDKPYEVNLTGEKSINADNYTWYIDNEVVSNEMSFKHKFENRGEHKVYLETSQNGVNCVHTDSATIHITEIIAGMFIPKESCVSNPTILDASTSQDVHFNCQAGYLWQFENQRPREVNDDSLSHFLLPGHQTITLIVEDINGCKDTISDTTTAYDLQANLVADSLICLPSEIELTDLSVGDTTIVSWNWDFGNGSSIEQNPTHRFDSLAYDPSLLEDSITVTLFIEDAIGCVDTTEFIIETYDIFSELTMNNGPIICQNDIITFSAADYLEGGSFLNYEWDFGSAGSSSDNNPTITFTDSGEHLVTLIFTEDATGCQGTLDTLISVTPTPIADFISDQDSVEFICFPEQISFSNTSIIGDDATYLWDFGNGAMSDIENPIIPFDKGTYEVQLIVSTMDGCRDTISRSYTLVGPEGAFSVDKNEICPGEEITFTLENATDVSSYTWDFGDGVQVDNESPVTHVYDPDLSVTEFTPTLILRSDEYGCELIQDIPITVYSITADFDFSTDLCPGELSFSSDFENPQFIEWNIDGQIISGTSNPSVEITSNESTIDVTLKVTDVNGCEVERMRTFDTPDLEDTGIQFPNVFSPNGDNTNPVFNIYYGENIDANNVEVIEFKVYDRWGELLYDNANPALGWDGTYKGQIVPADVYAYYIEVSVNGCSSKSKKGNVTVIK